MTRRMALTATALLGLVALLLLQAKAAPEQANTLARLGKDRLDAARKTYEVKWKNYREGIRVNADLLYLWSVRWLEAEKTVAEKEADKVAAFRGHFGRMRELDRLLHDLQRAGQTTVDEITATEFYRSEAEFWYFQARGEKKEP